MLRKMLGCDYLFTDGHAVMIYTAYYDRRSDLNQIDWDLMGERYWYDTETDPDRKRRRQAECLVYERVPWESIVTIGVRDEGIASRVEDIVEKSEAVHRPEVETRTDWYY